MATTIINSMRVNPRSFFFERTLLIVESSCYRSDVMSIPVWQSSNDAESPETTDEPW